MLNTRETILKQVEEIQKHRWIESKKRGYDVGNDWAALDWISKYAKSFRENLSSTHVRCY